MTYGISEARDEYDPQGPLCAIFTREDDLVARKAGDNENMLYDLRDVRRWDLSILWNKVRCKM
jgi:hypothetical protein